MLVIRPGDFNGIELKNGGRKLCTGQFSLAGTSLALLAC